MSGVPLQLQYGDSTGRNQRYKEEDQLNKIIVITQVRNVVVWANMVALERDKNGCI